MKRVFRYTVQEEFNKMPIKSLLQTHYHMSSKLITSLKQAEDGILVNGLRQRVTYSMHIGDTITLTMHDTVSENIVPVKMELDILYEDEDILLINKPPYLPAHPSMGNYDHTLANGVIHHWNSLGQTGVFRAVNRLDKNTSGIMIIARNAYTHARLCEQSQNGDLIRRYQAIVCGRLEKGGTVDAPIAREGSSVIKRCIRGDGQRAVTHYRVIKNLSDYTLIELSLETGRTHQIRVHMSSIGHPVAGDFLYGKEDSRIRQALHSCYAEFIHPVTLEKMSFSCALPKDMNEFINIAK